MGAPAQANSPTQVYYDPEKQQYFSYKQQDTGNAFLNMLSNSGVPVTVNGQALPSQGERIYLSNP